MATDAPAEVRAYMTRREICRRLHISWATSYRLQREGHLPFPVRFGRLSRWPITEIEALERRASADRGGHRP
jgi:excisionase family DNA binding protein